MSRVTDTNRAVVVACGGYGGELSTLAIEGGGIARREVSPLAHFIRHETDAVDAVPVIEPVDRHDAVADAKRGLQADIHERVAGGWSRERDLIDAPTLHGFRGCQTQTEQNADDESHRPSKF